MRHHHPAPAIASLLLAVASVSWGGETVQIDVTAALNSRSVTTLSPRDGAEVLVTWDAEVGYGATGGCGYMTAAAWARANTAGKKATALPDDGVFPATDTRPRVELHYANANGTAPQTRTVRGPGAFSFAVAPARFERVMLFFSAAPNLWTDIVVTATYQDGSAVAVPTKVPEFSLRVRRPIPDQAWSVLVDDVGKWDAQNACREAGHHFIDGFDLRPDPTKVLTGISVEAKPESPKSVLTFWGATGVTAAASGTLPSR